MALDPQVVRTESGTWLFTWAVGTSPYTLWLDGVLLESGLLVESYEWTDTWEYQDEAPPLEVLEDGDTAENETYPPRFTLQWRGLQNAALYVVERFISASWVEVANLQEDARGYYEYTSLPLDDGATHLFRVTAVSQSGAEGVPITLSSNIERNPAPPAVSFSVSGSDVVVSAA
jgi:hypothetical protein